MNNNISNNKNELALTPDNYVGEVQDIQARQAIEALGNAMQITQNTIQKLFYGDIVTSEQLKQEMVTFKQEVLKDIRTNYKEDVRQAVAENNKIVERRKKQYEKAYNQSVYRILGCSDDKCPKYLLFSVRVRSEMKKKMEKYVGTRIEFYNDETLFKKAMEVIRRITIGDKHGNYDQLYKKWCADLTKQYNRGFDNLETNRQKMIEAYESYFFNNQN